MNIAKALRDRLERRRSEQRQRFARIASTLAAGGTDAESIKIDDVERTLHDLNLAPDVLDHAVDLLQRRRELLDTFADHDAALEELRHVHQDQKRLEQERDELLRKLRERAEIAEDARRAANNRHQAALAAQLQLRDVDRQLREVLGEQEAQRELDAAEHAQRAGVAAVASLEADLAAARRALDDVRHNHKVAPGPDADRVLARAAARVADLEAKLATAVEQRERADAALDEAREAGALA